MLLICSTNGLTRCENTFSGYKCTCGSCFNEFKDKNGVASCKPKCDLSLCDESTGVCETSDGKPLPYIELAIHSLIPYITQALSEQVLIHSFCKTQVKASGTQVMDLHSARWLGSAGLSLLGVAMMILAGLILVGGVGFLAYRWRIRQEMRDEVKSILKQYMPLAEGEEQGTAPKEPV